LYLLLHEEVVTSAAKKIKRRYFIERGFKLAFRQYLCPLVGTGRHAKMKIILRIDKLNF
jgi:hypothetical protein